MRISASSNWAERMAENILRISLEVHIHSLIFFTLSKQQKKSHYGAGAYNIKRNQINTQVSKEDIQKNKALGKKSEILPTHFIWRSFSADQMSSVNFYLTSLGSDSQSTSSAPMTQCNNFNHSFVLSLMC